MTLKSIKDKKLSREERQYLLDRHIQRKIKAEFYARKLKKIREREEYLKEEDDLPDS